jgi:acetoin utilization deacetylase AcuC-like enzyme
MTAAGRVLLLTDAAMGAHATRGHPERPERLEAAARGVEDGALAAGAAIERSAVRSAEDAELERIHPGWYLAALEDLADQGGGWIDPDTYVSDGSVAAARLAAGATIDAARAAIAGEAGVAFAVVRPPGHHARPDRASGFCLLNNIALAVAAARAEDRARRIAIVDWDGHHGDGTQAIFDDDPDLCYASTHQSPLFPGTGATDERGRGAAVGTKHNRPLPPGSGDEALLDAWQEDLLPAIAAFAPEVLLVSAGYDAHHYDPMANLGVTDDGYHRLGTAVGTLARSLGLPGVALTLEGGYDLAALRRSTAASVHGLLQGLRS